MTSVTVHEHLIRSQSQKKDMSHFVSKCVGDRTKVHCVVTSKDLLGSDYSRLGVPIAAVL